MTYAAENPIRMCLSRYPTRIEHEDIMSRFNLLSVNVDHRRQNDHLQLSPQSKFSSKDKANNLFSKLSIEESSVIQVSVLDWKDFYSLLWMGWLFKVLVALFDTPIIYFALWALRDKIKPTSYLEEN